jgi:hypothetical protein
VHREQAHHAGDAQLDAGAGNGAEFRGFRPDPCLAEAKAEAQLGFLSGGSQRAMKGVPMERARPSLVEILSEGSLNSAFLDEGGGRAAPHPPRLPITTTHPRQPPTPSSQLPLPTCEHTHLHGGGVQAQLVAQLLHHPLRVRAHAVAPTRSNESGERNETGVLNSLSLEF